MSVSVIGGQLFGDNGAAFSGGNLFHLASVYDSAASGSTDGESLLNTELDGGYGYPLVVESSSDDSFKVYGGGGVNGVASVQWAAIRDSDSRQRQQFELHRQYRGLARRDLLRHLGAGVELLEQHREHRNTVRMLN